LASGPAQRHDGSETAMKQSTTRILTTHTGSLPRPQNLLTLPIEEQARHGIDRTALDSQRDESAVPGHRGSWIRASARLPRPRAEPTPSR
jgi:hypothetical protein